MENKKSIIVAYDENNGIGINNELPWKYGDMKTDMKLFKNRTTANTVIMGRKTFESIGKPLPDRRNIVLTRNLDYDFDGIEVAHSLEEAFEIASSVNCEVFVIGGSEIYQQAIDKVDKMYITKVHEAFANIDSHFPVLDESTWTEIVSENYNKKESGDKYDFDVVVYDRNRLDLVNLNNARFDDQKNIMEELAKEGVCPFCEEGLKRCHKAEILKTGDHWSLTYNQYPYENSDLHLLAIAKYHASTLRDMKPGAFNELFEMFKWAENNFNLTYGAVCMRFGDITRTGATLDHLHVHMIVAAKDLPKGTKLKFKIGVMPS